MVPLDYTNMCNRFGKKLEKELMQDFPGDAELLGKVSDLMTLLHYTILGAYVRDFDGKEKSDA